MLHRPNFLIIGAARTGTSWLRHTLATHPRIFVLRPELRYLFSGPSEAIASKIARAYYEEPIFVAKSAEEATHDSVFGEKSPTHLAAPISSIRKLRELVPDARIICGIREPIDRVLSHLVNQGIDYSEPVETSRIDYLLRFGLYEEALRNWANIFHPDQILLHSFDNLRQDPENVVVNACRHIGVRPLEVLRTAPGLRPPLKPPSRPPAPQLLEYLSAACANAIYDIPTLQAVMHDAWASRSKRRS